MVVVATLALALSGWVSVGAFGIACLAVVVSSEKLFRICWLFAVPVFDGQRD